MNVVRFPSDSILICKNHNKIPPDPPSKEIKTSLSLQEQAGMSPILLNLLGGDCVEDINRLEKDEGLCNIIGRVEKTGMSRQQQRSFIKRFRKGRERTATLDMDATLVETNKSEALYCYKGFKSYQPLNTWWAEQEMVLHTEFRDGNVPAGYDQLRVFIEALNIDI